MSILIKVVVGQFELVERKRLFHPVGTGSWRVRVDIQSTRHVGFSFTGDDPF